MWQTHCQKAGAALEGGSCRSLTCLTFVDLQDSSETQQGADAPPAGDATTGRCWPADLLHILFFLFRRRVFVSADEDQLTPSPDPSLTLDGSFSDSLQRPEE